MPCEGNHSGARVWGDMLDIVCGIVMMLRGSVLVRASPMLFDHHCQYSIRTNNIDTLILTSNYSDLCPAPTNVYIDRAVTRLSVISILG